MSIKLGKRDVLLGNLWQAGGVGGRIPKNWLSPRKKNKKKGKVYLCTYTSKLCMEHTLNVRA